MLYPITEFSMPEEGEGRFTISSGALGTIPLILPMGGILVIRMHQLIADQNNLPQDYSIRGWISAQKGGNPIVDNPTIQSGWTLSTL